MPPVTVSEQYDAVLTTTLRNMRGELRDNITRSNKVIAWLEGNGRVRRVSGGERIQVPLMYALNTGADIYSGYGITNIVPQDGITSAFYPWAQLSVPVTISGLEEMQNSGDNAVLSLFGSKVMQAEASAKQLLNQCVVMGRISGGATGSLSQFLARVGKVDPGAAGPLPIPALVDANPSRSVSVGSINGANEGWWQNQAIAATSVVTSYASYKHYKGRLYNNCARGMYGAPDLILSDQLIWELYFNSLQSQERYVINNQRTIDMLGGAGDEMLKFRGAVHIWDEVVPDVGTTTATPETEEGFGDGVGTYLASGTHGTEFHLNTRCMEYIVHSQRDWVNTPFIKPANQDSRSSHMLWMGQVTVNNRRKQGVMYDIDNSIAA